MVRRVPFIGGPLASALSFAAPAVLGAVSVLPTTAAAQFLGAYVPQMNSSLFYALVGLGLAGIAKATSFFGRSFHDALALALATGGGAVALYKWQTGSDVPMATETAGLAMRSPLAGIGTLIVGGRRFAGYGDYGPAAVRPMTYAGY
jgi:hypothetical protein